MESMDFKKTAIKTKLFKGSVLPCENQIELNEELTLDSIHFSLEYIGGHALHYIITRITKSKTGWTDVFKCLRDAFLYTGIPNEVIT